MKIRKAIESDFETIRYLNQEIFDFECAHCDPFEDINYPRSEAGETFFRNIVEEKNGHSGWIYEEDGIAKGYVSLREPKPGEYSHRKNIKPLQLQTFCVGQNFRGQGIGRKLIEHAQTIAKDYGYTHLRVCALAKNEIARSLYSSSGFHEQEIMYEINL